jgi:nucleoid DNA-binding protein
LAIDTPAGGEESSPRRRSSRATQPQQRRDMNKIKLIETVQKDIKSSKADAERAVNAVIAGIKSHLKKSKSMQLVGFGTFRVVNRKARLGVNPKTGERIQIKASKSVKFSAGKDLKSRL